ncbi:MAG: type II toxin-antitoxin system PemK/MazF family toxin [bacterium]|nr:type II toxin-antitoxin system PemK/MazF family toxin [bacterium]
MVKSYVPERGDMVWLTFDPTIGHEQGGHRPALVVTQKIFNARHRLAFVIPISSKAKGYSDEVPFFNEHISGALLVAHSRSIDWHARRAEYVAKIDDSALLEAQERLETYLIKKDVD